MSSKRESQRLDIKLSSSIKEINGVKRNFCIIRNISSTGVFLTAKVKLFEGQQVECIISFNEQSIFFTGIIRRIKEDEGGYIGYGIEIIDINKENEKILIEFVQAGYLPQMEEE